MLNNFCILSVDIYLKPIANAPIMKKQKWCVDSSKQISWILWFVAKYIKLEPQEKLVREYNFLASQTIHKFLFSFCMLTKPLHQLLIKA